MDFSIEEEKDGVRFSWNVWPATRSDAAKVVLPVSCMYSPLKKITSPRVNYEPVTCKGQSCRTVLNPFCSIDLVGKLWICPFCLQRNNFPPFYSEMSATNLPAELIPMFTTLEYQLPRAPCPPPIFLFVVDTCMDEDELQALKESLILSLSLLPEDAMVGLITFGPTVHIYELAFPHCPKSYVFNGSKELNTKQIQTLLGITVANPQAGGRPAPQQGAQPRFIVPRSECEQTLEKILEELQRDPHPVKSDRRPLRSTGVALAVAISLLEAYVGYGARLMLFTGGPCTSGPGQVVGDELKEPIRSHTDLQKDHAKHVKKATKYYEELAKQVANNGHATDIFACGVDQVGVLEMQDLVKKTCGFMILSDTFKGAIFKNSFARIFDIDQNLQLNMAFNATLEVQASRELKVCGAIGHCTAVPKKGPSVAETEIGIGGTTCWKLCSMDPNISTAFYFEVVNQQPGASKGLIQFQTHYQSSKGQRILRVTTVCHSFADADSPNIPLGFDQEAAAVLLARIAVYKAESEDTFDVLRWLDRTLIRLMSKFAEYRKDEPNSFTVGRYFSLYPQFMYHLRRGPFLQVFNCSPDETTFNRFMLNRENVLTSLTMIQPTLDEYSFNGPPRPVLLSAASIAPDKIFLLDTFFHVIVFSGETIKDWRNKGYQNDPNFANFKALLEAPKVDAANLMKDRFPQPRYIECDQGSSPARFVYAVIDPDPGRGGPGRAAGDQLFFTEDVSYETFMEHLKKLVVSS